MTAPIQPPHPPPAWTAPASPEAAGAAGMKQTYRGTQMATEGPNAGYNVETWVFDTEIRRDNKYYAATAVYQRIAGTKGATATDFGAWRPPTSSVNLSRLPDNMKEIMADPELKDAYQQMVKAWAEHSMMAWAQKSSQHAKKAFKPQA
jgi:hypothetical protein